MYKQLATIAATGLISSTAWAGATYGFTNITNNNATDAAIGEAQFSLEVKDTGPFVEFFFSNSGPDTVALTNLYWDDASSVLSSLVSWTTTTPAGVDYSGGDATPNHLPGASPTDFQDFSIQPKVQGGPKNGVNPSENVSILFTAVNDYLSVIEALDSGDLRVGVRAQAFDGEGSEGFINSGGDQPNPPTPPAVVVPSPTAAFAGLALLAIVAGRRRRRD